MVSRAIDFKATNFSELAKSIKKIYLLEWYFREKRKNEIEDEVPDMLLLASSMQGGQGIIRMIEFISKNSKGPLGDEFSTALNETRHGSSPENALINIAVRNCSSQLDMAISLLVSALESGADMKEAFRLAAEDCLATKSIEREREATTAMQKYTLMAAGALVVPFILGKLGSLAADFSTMGTGEFFGTANSNSAAIISAARNSSLIYLIEFCLISSFFIAMLEGKKAKFLIYAAALVPVSVAVYFASSLAG